MPKSHNFVSILTFSDNMKKYLFLVSLTYGFPIMRPLQKAIRARGDEAAWFFDEPGLERYLDDGERWLKSVDEVMEYRPDAVFTAGDHMYHFFPGTKVEVFHGFDIDKRPGRFPSALTIRGWFDLYCANDRSTLERLTPLSEKYGSFRVVPTGWPKLDAFFDADGRIPSPDNKRPLVLYSSTFTSWITSTPFLYDEISRLAREKEWDWIITFHPKMEQSTVERYKALAAELPNVTFYEGDDNVGVLKQADVMLCDSSSIIFEFLYLDKPVVTFRNTMPGDYLIDIDDPALLECSLSTALERPADLMARIRAKMDSMHPQRDGRSSERVLAAVDDFQTNWQGKLRKKRVDLFRRFKARKRLGYFKLK